MVVAVSTERYRAVCHPLMRRQAYYKYIIIVVILSITIEFPRFFEMKLINDNSAYWTTDLMENPDYVLFSSYWNDIIVTGLLPLVLLCYLNLRVFIKIKVNCLIHCEYLKEHRSTSKYPNIPQSTQKYIKVHRSTQMYL